MKTIILNYPGRFCSRVPRLGVVTVVALLLAASHLPAASLPAVSTISGGKAGTPRYGYVDGDTKNLAQFHTPIGMALDSAGFNGSGRLLYVADRDNNAIRKLDLDLNQTITFLNTNNGIRKPVGVALDSAGNLYVLNRGANGTDGTVLSFNRYGNLLGTNAVSLAYAEGIALDGSANIYVTVNSNTVVQIFPGTYPGAMTTVASVASRCVNGTWLRGIAVKDDGMLAVCDSGCHGVLLIDPTTGNATDLTGFHGQGDQFGIASYAQFNQPYGLANAGSGMLVVADYGNHRVKVVDSVGSVCNLYGVCSNNWVTGSGTYPGWFDGNGCPCEITCQICDGYAEARLPAGVVVGPAGTPDAGKVYSTEDFYHLIRLTDSKGLLSGPGGSASSSGTNAVVTSPVITTGITNTPNSGYYPMGRLITVNSPNPNVYYTTDGTEPTTNSLRVVINGNVGTIHWFNSTNDLTGLHVKAFVGTNSSATVSGQPVGTNNVGTPPGPSADGALYAGIGSTIVVPVVANLRTNDQVKSFQFRVEVTPNGAAPMIPSGSSGFNALDISTNDFIPVVTAVQGQGVTTGSVNVVTYTNGTTSGLEVTAIGNSGNTFFQRFAVVAMLKVPIPTNASPGDRYSLAVSFPSATSDGINTPVSLTPMAAATILVTNVAYTVGDSASLFGAWYNAGTFGDGDLENSDVNNAFYATSGLRVPYAFSDVFNAMDAFPPDAQGFVGGDGEIRFLDWQTILERSLRLDPNNWTRAWSIGGNLTNSGPFALAPHPALKSQHPLTASPWYRQVLVGAVSESMGYAQGAGVSVPVYVKLGDGSTLSGLQFRAVVTPQNGAPPLAQAPQLILASGIAAPSAQQSFNPDSTAFGWSLGSFNFQSRSSNFLGWLHFTLPSPASTGQGYTVSFANADGAPNPTTQYNFETRSASVVVNAPAPPASICSDDWKLQFFGSLTNANAADLADPDGDGFPNWMEYLAGTNPTNAASKLRFTGIQNQLVSGQSQIVLHWLTAPGKAYEVQWSSSLFGGAWNILGTTSGDGNVAAYSDSGTNGTRFYRLQILP